jgi:hypothetical protein
VSKHRPRASWVLLVQTALRPDASWSQDAQIHGVSHRLVTGAVGVELFSRTALSTVGDECRLQLATDRIEGRRVHISNAIIEAGARAMTANKSVHGPSAVISISCAIAREGYTIEA